ncbi:carboxylesterase [Methylosinus sp. Ce-a6]|uniref:alpha/beta hydrolase n=1 Tax=Methylosinus sp. Ce-a6 TaxID=2172005 RepID=UPI00135C8F3D|nr:alpha/beta hydrolase [Methylosinus sp. Ce-a6]
MAVDGVEEGLSFIDLSLDGREPWRIARRCRATRGTGTERAGVMLLGGFKSDMRGAKAAHLDAWAERTGHAFVRFDYSGHGESSGRFEDGTIGDWLAQSLAVFDASTRGPQILVGSSMGGWLALLLARRLAEQGRRLRGLVLIAPAVDFTEELIWKNADDDIRRAILEDGAWLRPSPYSPEPTPITRKLIEDGRAHLLLGDVIRTYAPVHILQGMCDEDVPYAHALRLLDCLAADPVVLTLVTEGDHRLSREADLAHLTATVEALG